MPTRAPRRCTKSGCGNRATREGRCPEHSLSRSGDHTQTTTERGLGHAWRQLVARAIRDHPWCVDCGTRGDDDNPLTGDHIIPRSVAPHLALDPRNITVRCKRHNSSKGPRATQRN